ncbi:MAG: hypothetical protein K0U38_06215 [Epsilonproteobacteria bacterium]|nr:hypothetical protein [Campylobacterota bacterium]
MTSFTNATHMHIGEEEHIDDCQICIIVNAFNDIDTSSMAILFECGLCNCFIEPLHTAVIQLTYLKGFFAHAPPILSL